MADRKVRHADAAPGVQSNREFVTFGVAVNSRGHHCPDGDRATLQFGELGQSAFDSPEDFRRHALPHRSRQDNFGDTPHRLLEYIDPEIWRES